MLTKSYEFENGRARMLNKGVVLWNGSDDEISAENPRRWLGDLVYEMLGEERVWSHGYNLKGIKITIEIGEATRQ